MTRGLVGRIVVARVVVVSRCRQLEQTPSLVDTEHADDVRSCSTGEALRTVRAGHDARCRRTRRVPQVACVVSDLVLRRNRRGNAIAQVGGVRQLVHTGDVATTTNQTVKVVGGIVVPGGVELGICLTQREAGELNEGVVNANGIAARDASVLRRTNCAGDVSVRRGPAERRIEVGADHAVLGGGARIDVQIFAGACSVVIAEAVARAECARPSGSIIDAAVECGVNAQITAQLDASVGARDVEETGTIQGADPHVLDRFGLDGKISCLSPTHGEQTRR